MKLTEQIELESRQLKERFKDNSYLRELEHFYFEMLHKGFIRKQEYTLPLPDTVGSSFRSTAGISNTAKL